MVNENKPVMILGSNIDICSILISDLKSLDFNPLKGIFPDIDRKDIAEKSPSIIILELTESKHGNLSACKLLLDQDILPPGTLLVALVSEDTMGHIPPEFRFADIIKFPCSITELGYRLRRLISLRHQEPAEDTIYIGNLSFSPTRHEVKVDGQPVILSHKEYELLRHFVTHPDHVFTRRALLSSIWGYDASSDSRTVDVHIRRVRAKLGDDDKKYIKTVRGTGYILRSRD